MEKEMTLFIITIVFESKKYKEEGVLTYKTMAETREQAEQNALDYIAKETKKDKNYTYTAMLVIDIDALSTIQNHVFN